MGSTKTRVKSKCQLRSPKEFILIISNGDEPLREGDHRKGSNRRAVIRVYSAVSCVYGSPTRAIWDKLRKMFLFLIVIRRTRSTVELFLVLVYSRTAALYIQANLLLTACICHVVV